MEFHPGILRRCVGYQIVQHFTSHYHGIYIVFLILLVKVSKSLYEIRDREVKLNTYAEYDFQAH